MFEVGVDDDTDDGDDDDDDDDDGDDNEEDGDDEDDNDDYGGGCLSGGAQVFKNHKGMKIVTTTYYLFAGLHSPWPSVSSPCLHN